MNKSLAYYWWILMLILIVGMPSLAIFASKERKVKQTTQKLIYKLSYYEGTNLILVSYCDDIWAREGRIGALETNGTAHYFLTGRVSYEEVNP